MTAPDSIAVHGRWVLVHEDGGPRIVADRWVLVEGGRIAAVVAGRPAAARTIDRRDALVLPGLLNLHHHCFSEMLVRNRTEDHASEAFETSLVYGLLMPISRIGAETMSPADRRDAARLGLLQVLKGGATTLMEPFRNGFAEIFDAAEDMGIRFYGAPYLFSTADPRLGSDGRMQYRSAGGNDDGAADLERWVELHRAWNGRAGDRIRVTLSPHATDTCGPDLLREVRRKADALGCEITIHVAQSLGELEQIRQRYGREPAEYLEWVGLLGPDLLAAHCLHASDADLDRLRRHGATVLNCPRTFARGGRMAPFDKFARRGVRTVVGTDGYANDIAGELTAAGTISKLFAGNSGVTTARDLIRAVTLDAAAALRRDDLGRIAPDARADLTVVDLGKAHYQPVSDPLRAFVWMGRGDVSTVIVDGRIVVDGGRYELGDEDAIVAAGVAAVERVWNRDDVQAMLARA